MLVWLSISRFVKDTPFGYLTHLGLFREEFYIFSVWRISCFVTARNLDIRPTLASSWKSEINCWLLWVKRRETRVCGTPWNGVWNRHPVQPTRLIPLTPGSAPAFGVFTGTETSLPIPRSMDATPWTVACAWRTLSPPGPPVCQRRERSEGLRMLWASRHWVTHREQAPTERTLSFDMY